ncbi:MAG TPA: hypothetical protein VK797_23030 [Tepidisphaeraceae bacterium]|jgi:hypothetical protein|nr:hypothetical protein [Tepidisphaeraceae bacterium]
MPFDQHKNLAYTLVATAPAPASSGTTLVVSAGGGSLFPPVPFNATVWPTGSIPMASNAEIVRVTNVSTDTLTIVRTQEGTSARSIVVGDQIAATITVKTITDIETAFAGTNGAITGGSITVNTSGVSVNLPPYLTTADLSQNSSNYAGVNGAITGGSITVNTSGVSVNLPPYLTTAMQSNAATISNVNISAGATSNNLSALTFSNSNGVSFGLTGSTLTATVATNYQSPGPYLTTAMQSNAATISNINLSAGATSNNLSAVTFSNSNNVSFGLSGSTITATASFAAQSNQSGNVYASSNTFGTSSGTYDARSISIAGSGAVSVAASNSGWVISAPAQTVQTQNCVDATLAGNSTSAGAGYALISSGTMTLAGGNNVTLSQNGNAVTVSAASQTVQTQNCVDVTLSGNSTSAGAGYVLISSGTMVLAGGNNITLSQNGNSVTVSAANAVAQTNQTGNLYASSNTFSSTSGTYDARSISIAGSGAVSVAATNSGWIISAPTQTVQTQNCVDLSLSGNSTSAGAGYILISSGTAILAGGNNITLSQNGQSVTISGANAAAAPVNFSAGANSGNLGSVVFSNSNNVSFGLNGSTITATASQSVQTQNCVDATLAGNSTSAGAGYVLISSGTMTLAGGNNVTLSQNGNAVTVSAFTQTVQTQNCVDVTLSGNSTSAGAGYVLVSSGTLVLAGGNNVTLSQNGNSVTVSAFTQTVQTQNCVDLSLAGNSTSAGAGYALISSGTAILAGGNNVTLSQNGQSVTISAASQTNQTGSVYASSNTFGTSSGSYDARSISMAGSGACSIAASNSGWVVSVPQTSSLSGTGLVSISVNASTISIGVPAYTNSYFEPYEFNVGSATTSGGLGTMFLQPFRLDNYLSFNVVNVIASASLTSTSAANTVTFSNGGASSFNANASYSFTNSNLVDLYLFSRGSGGFTDELWTFASTRNSFVTYEGHTYAFNVTNSTISISSSAAATVSFPSLTSNTMTTINAATTITTWAPGYGSWTSSISNSSSTTGATGATSSFSLTGTWMATTAWASNKIVPLAFASSLSPGDYWIGVNMASSTSSSSSSASTSGAAGRTFTLSVNASNLTLSGQLTYVGFTNSLASSLGRMGQGSAATMAPSPGHGSFSATYSPASTYLNNAGQANGAIAFSQISTAGSLFKTWLEFANNRV